jgi:hypothetical protein
MAGDARIATHSDPARRDRSNYIIRVALEQHGLPGEFEQMWARTDDAAGGYELCSIPFFTYGLSLGDRVSWNDTSRDAVALSKSGRKTVRFAFQDRGVASARHEEFHGDLVPTGCLLEFFTDGYGALDIADEVQERAVLSVLGRWYDEGTLSWEWADPVES